MMLRAGHSEKIDRPECETTSGTVIERELDLLATVAPYAIVVPALETSEVGCTRAEKHARLVALDCHLRGDDIGRPFNPVPPRDLYEVGRVIGPVRLAVPVPGVFAEELVIEYNEC